MDLAMMAVCWSLWLERDNRMFVYMEADIDRI